MIVTPLTWLSLTWKSSSIPPVSDLLFCLVGIPAALMTSPGVGGGAAYLYNVCRVPLHNLFLFSSTWIAALIAAERFFVVVSPLRARMCLKVSQSQSRM